LLPSGWNPVTRAGIVTSGRERPAQPKVSPYANRPNAYIVLTAEVELCSSNGGVDIMQGSNHSCRLTLSQVLPAVLLCVVLIQPVAYTAHAESEDVNPADKTLTLEGVRTQIAERGYSWTAGNTSLSQLPPEELARRMGTRLPDDYDDTLKRIRSRPPTLLLLDLPANYDWSDSISMPPIREQLCGDCWAQAVTAAMECQIRIHDHDTTSLAVQQVIDCNFGHSNCAGGFLSDACAFFTYVGGIAEECYPYVGADMTCNFDTCDIVGRLDGFEDIDTTVVSIKTHLMTYGPIPVALGVLHGRLL
jgi:hypothetical protein